MIRKWIKIPTAKLFCCGDEMIELFINTDFSRLKDGAFGNILIEVNAGRIVIELPPDNYCLHKKIF